MPIELGKTYQSEDSSQRQMTVNEFIDQYVLSQSQGVGYLAQHQFIRQVPLLRRDFCIPDFCALLLPLESVLAADLSADVGGDNDVVGAGGDESRVDCNKNVDHDSNVVVDGDCFDEEEDDEVDGEDEDEDVLIHFWFGPSTTQSPLHHDPYHNLLAQVHGFKYVRLYPYHQQQHHHQQ